LAENQLSNEYLRFQLSSSHEASIGKLYPTRLNVNFKEDLTTTSDDFKNFTILVYIETFIFYEAIKACPIA
jgi:hypothetical protein